MAARKKGLGRGLNALLGNAKNVNELTNPEPASTVHTQTNSAGLQHIAIDLIERGSYQPRVHFEPEA